jgi:hypothetical protein
LGEWFTSCWPRLGKCVGPEFFTKTLAGTEISIGTIPVINCDEM